LDKQSISLVEPLGYLGFLQLESMAKLVLSDSGGVQEETCWGFRFTYLGKAHARQDFREASSFGLYYYCAS